MTATQLTSYSALPNNTVQAANGISYAYPDIGGHEGTVPLVLLQHFRGNLDRHDTGHHRADGQGRHRLPHRSGRGPD